MRGRVLAEEQRGAERGKFTRRVARSQLPRALRNHSPALLISETARPPLLPPPPPMPRRPKVPLGPSRLSQILQALKKEPRPQLDTVKSLKLTLAFRNDHFGARYVGFPAVALASHACCVSQALCEGGSAENTLPESQHGNTGQQGTEVSRGEMDTRDASGVPCVLDFL